MNDYFVILFYKFVDISDPAAVVLAQKEKSVETIPSAPRTSKTLATRRFGAIRHHPSHGRQEEKDICVCSD